MSEILENAEPWAVWYAWHVLTQQRDLQPLKAEGLLVLPSANKFAPPADLFREVLRPPTGTKPDLFDAWRGRWASLLSVETDWNRLLRYEQVSSDYASWRVHFMVAPTRWLGLHSWSRLRRPFAHVVPMRSDLMLCARVWDQPEAEVTRAHWQCMQQEVTQQRSAWRAAQAKTQN